MKIKTFLQGFCRGGTLSNSSSMQNINNIQDIWRMQTLSAVGGSEEKNIWTVFNFFSFVFLVLSDDADDVRLIEHGATKHSSHAQHGGVARSVRVRTHEATRALRNGAFFEKVLA